MVIELHLIPQDFINLYNLNSIAKNGKVLAKIVKGMHSLKQAGKLAYDDLVKHLKPHGYERAMRTPGLWTYKHSKLTFTLIADDFGIKYADLTQAQHLITALKEKHEVTVDWTGTLHAGATLQWDYLNRTVTLSMPGYIKKLLLKYNHPEPKRAQHAPRQPEPIQYGDKTHTTTIDTSHLLDKEKLREYQSILGTTFYYARIVDLTILCANDDLSLDQSKATQQSQQHLHTLLDYLHKHPNASVTFCASDMILKVHSDGSYLSVLGGRSRVAGHFYCGDNIPIQQTDEKQGSIYQECSAIKPVLASAAECGTSTLFLDCQTAISLRIAAKEMGHPQPATPTHIDNTTANNYVHNNLQHKKSKAFNMRLHWLRD